MIPHLRVRRAALPAFLTSLILTLTVCDSRDPIAPAVGSGEIAVRVVSGDAQRGQFGTELPNPIVVQALDSRGRPMKDQLVNFRVIEGGGSVFAGASLTNKEGIAQDYWTLGPNLGLHRLEVRAVDPATGAKLVFATLVATATPVPVATVLLQQVPVPITMEVGDRQLLEPVVLDAAGNILSDRIVTFTSSNAEVASVDEEGNLLANAPGGPITITASSEGKSASVQLTVVTARVWYVNVMPYSAEMLVGATTQFYATPLDRYGVALDRPVTWTSSDETVATVSNTGLVTALLPGSAVISATSEGIAASANVSASYPVASITLTPATQVIPFGETAVIVAELRAATGELVTGRTLQWTSSDPDVVSVWAFDTQAHVSNVPLGPGVTITATVDGVSATATVSVRSLIPDPFEPNNSAATAFQLPTMIDNNVPVIANGWMHYEDDHDWFRISARETTGGTCLPGATQQFRLSVTLTEIPAGTDYDLYLANSSGTTLRSSQFGGTSNEVIEHNVTGTCGINDEFDLLVRVRNYSASINETPYRLSISFRKL